MKQRGKILKGLVYFLTYPDERFSGNAEALSRLFQGYDSLSAGRFETFLVRMNALLPEEREEIFTRTFDVTPVCIPYVSIHLFGEENFKRGEMMARLNARYEEMQFDPAGELPDHVVVLLRYAAGVDDGEFQELVRFCLLGPIARMIAANGEENPYCILLETIQAVLKVEAPGVAAEVPPVQQQQAASCAPSGGCSCGPVMSPEKVEPLLT